MSTDAPDDLRIARNLTDSFAAPTDGPETDRLRALLATRADDEGLLEVAYRTVDTPIGVLLLAATEEGLVRVAFELEGHDAVLAQLAAAVSPRILRSGRRTD